MALTIVEQASNERMYILPRKLWLGRNSDMSINDEVYEDGDPRAASLLGSAGARIPMARAVALGLVKDGHSSGTGDQGTGQEGEGTGGGSSSEETPYEDMTVSVLKAILEQRKLGTSGNKQELVDRLYDKDIADAEAEAAEAGEENE